MRAAYTAMCRVPVNSLLLWEVSECTRVDKVPFVPVPGMLLKLTPAAPWMRVREVRWDAEQSALLRVFMAEPENLADLPWSGPLAQDGWAILDA